MSKFTPRLVKDEDGNLCMQVLLGGLSATLKLPPDFQSWEEARKDSFYEMAVSEMKGNLLEMRRTDQRKLRRMAD